MVADSSRRKQLSRLGLERTGYGVLIVVLTMQLLKVVALVLCR